MRDALAYAEAIVGVLLFLASAAVPPTTTGLVWLVVIVAGAFAFIDGIRRISFRY